MKLPYGFYLNSDGAVSINEEKVNTVHTIFSIKAIDNPRTASDTPNGICFGRIVEN